MHAGIPLFTLVMADKGMEDDIVVSIAYKAGRQHVTIRHVVPPPTQHIYSVILPAV